MDAKPLVELTIPCPEPQPHGMDPSRASRGMLWAMKKRRRRAVYEVLLASLQANPNWRSVVLHSLENPVRRRVVFTRGLGSVMVPDGKGGTRPKHLRAYDRVNFCIAVKVLEDCLIMDRPRRPGLNLLWNDSPKWLDEEFRQEKCEVPPGMLRIQLYEVAK